MLTDNYEKFRISMFTGVGQTFKSCSGTTFTNTPMHSGLSDIGQHMSKAVIGALPTSTGSQYLTNGFGGVYFGTGSTPAWKGNITLESPITSGITTTSAGRSVAVKEADGRYSYTSLFSLSNTTSAEINIYEIGMFIPISSASSTYHCCLVERTVLSEPITIAPGSSKLVTYKITFNQTLNVE